MVPKKVDNTPKQIQSTFLRIECSTMDSARFDSITGSRQCLVSRLTGKVRCVEMNLDGNRVYQDLTPTVPGIRLWSPPVNHTFSPAKGEHHVYSS